jgi:hypothetical protein
MRVALRTTQLLAIGRALIGCDKAPTANELGQPNPMAENRERKR